MEAAVAAVAADICPGQILMTDQLSDEENRLWYAHHETRTHKSRDTYLAALMACRLSDAVTAETYAVLCSKHT